MTTWIDSHAHLSMFERDEIEGLIGRAADAGVLGVLVPATGPDDLEVVVGLAEEHSDTVVAAVGVHPHEAASLDAGVKRRLAQAIQATGVVAVGEIGLDYHYMSSPREDQLAALEYQLELALETDLPVVIHNRESWSDLEPRLTARLGRLAGVCHSFCEGPDEARRVIALGLKIGISGMVTFNGATNVRAIVKALSPGDLLVETDSPYLAPVPHRGRTNEPGNVALVGQRVARELDVSVSELSQVTTTSFQELFRLKKRPSKS
jgi:TatD DNase family protein